MRVLLLSPTLPPAPTGNAATVARWSRGLRERGHEVRLHDSSAPGAADALRRALAEGPFDLVHAHHAWKSGRVVLEAGRPRPPIVVTLGGTDIESDLDRPDRGERVREAFLQADGIGAYVPSHAERIRREFPGRPVRVLPKGVASPAEPPPPPPDEPILLLPAGRRPEKGVDRVFDLTAPLVAGFPGLRLRLAGPVLDPAFHAECARRAAGFSWVEDLGTHSPAVMGILYARAAVVLNVSRSEGYPNSILEAMAAGRPVLASDIPGNRPGVRCGETGFLFRDEAEFRDRARELLSSPGLRRRLGARAWEIARTEHPPGLEIEALLALYREATGQD